MGILCLEVNRSMKELHTEAAYWCTFDTGKTQWPQLTSSCSTKALVVGGGMSGLLTAYMLHERNIDFILVEAKEISEGSSLASTGLLQYCSDMMLHELRKQIGKQKADLFYVSCFKAVDQIRNIAKRIEAETGDVQLHTRSSLQLCSEPIDALKLEKEYEALSSLQLPCELWDQQRIARHFPFSKRSALITHQDAEINPHLFVIRLAQFLSKYNQALFERSKMTGFDKLADGSYQVTINNEHRIHAEYIIHAVGYHYEQLQQPQLNFFINRSYVLVTDPIDDLSFWHERMLIWETARPYLYMRTTKDSRIVIGGLDERSSILNKKDASLKNEQLLHELNKLFPATEAGTAYYWNAYFHEPKDGLPYVGSDQDDPKRLYLLGYGGNGMVYSMLGANLIAQTISGTMEQPELASILTLSRS